MHKGIGLDAFNELPASKAAHALFECCNSVIMAADLAASRPYADHSALFRKADSALFGLSEESVDEILETYTRPSLLARLHETTRPYDNDYETGRKALRNEIAKINQGRLERMLGPEGGYNNWV